MNNFTGKLYLVAIVTVTPHKIRIKSLNSIDDNNNARPTLYWLNIKANFMNIDLILIRYLKWHHFSILCLAMLYSPHFRCYCCCYSCCHCISFNIVTATATRTRYTTCSLQCTVSVIVQLVYVQEMEYLLVQFVLMWNWFRCT